jgi:hypothetical protein
LALAAVLSQSARGDEVKIENKIAPPSGVVVIEDESARSFKLQGHTQVYVAPPGTDLTSLSGKEVTLTVNPDGSVTKVERKTTTIQ